MKEIKKQLDDFMNQDPSSDFNFNKLLIFIYFDRLSEYEKVEKMYEYILKNIKGQNDSFVEEGMLLFGISQHVRLSKDDRLIRHYKNKINKMMKNIEGKWNEHFKSIFDEDKIQVNTSNLAILYGGLLSINYYIYNNDIGKTLRDIRDFVFNNHIVGDTLVDGNIFKEITEEILLSVIPFGLFDPESLIVVEAVKILEDNLIYDIQQESYVAVLLLIWYYMEKKEFQKANSVFSIVDKDKLETLLEKTLFCIVFNYIQENKEMSNVFIKHLPFGNDNRYESMNCERFPKMPVEGQEVNVKAITWPMQSDMVVNLTYWVEGGEKVIIKGIYNKNDGEEYWSFALGSFKKYEKVYYQLSLDDYIDTDTEIYEFNVLGKRVLKTVNIVEQKDDLLCVKCSDGNNDIKEDIFIGFQQESINIHIGMKDNHMSSEKFDLIYKNGIYTMETATYKVIINKDPFYYKIYKGSCDVITSEPGNSIVIYDDCDGEIHKIQNNFISHEKEGFYGFGERYNSINQRGNILDVYVYNQYKEQSVRTYIPMPYFISSNNYGLHIDEDEYIEFDMCSRNKKIYRFEIESNHIKYSIMLGQPKQIISNFTNKVGKSNMIPLWAFGPWMSSNNWDSEEEVRKQVELTKKYNIPATVLVIEAWSDEATYYIFNDAIYKAKDNSFGYNDFHFPKWGRWPDPKGLVQYLHENNLKCILWQIPIMKSVNGLHNIQKDIDEEIMINHQYCVKDNKGNPYRIPEGWFKDSLLMDFSNEEGRKWWFDKRKYLVDEIKIDGFKTDGGEFVFGRNISFNDGTTGKQMRNKYPNDYIKAYYDFINKDDPLRGITFSRAGFTGTQKYPAHWAGDERSNFAAFRRTVIAGLTSGMSGIPFWGWDIGGFSGDIPTAELFIRGTQMACFCPIMQYHAESKAEYNQDRTPWNIADRTGDGRVIEYYRYYANLRMNLLPYIYEQALNSVETGIPMMRAMFIEYPEDIECKTLEEQYMFGESLLVAPILYEGINRREVYLPMGKWVDFWNEVVYEGGKYMEVDASLDKIPVFVKYGAVIPLNLNEKGEIGGEISNDSEKYERVFLKIYGENQSLE